MNRRTHFEDLSTEIFFEIFDYFDALDIFIRFTSLNKKISSILQSIPLRLIIPYSYSRKQVDYLSSHLIHHSDQVISLHIYDTIRDDTSIISLLFDRHRFLNLQSCTFIISDSSGELENVIEEIRNLNKLVSFSIYHSNLDIINQDDIVATMFMHESSYLRTLVFYYPCYYQDLYTCTLIFSHLTSLTLVVSGPSCLECIYSILHILHFCPVIKSLDINLIYKKTNVYFSDLSPASINNENDYLILSKLIWFDLKMNTPCNIQSISIILRSMPNLKQFHFTLIYSTNWQFPGELLDGNTWKEIFERYVPYLSTFEFHMSIQKRYPRLDLDILINSFEYFSQKYADWYIIIDRWRLIDFERPQEFIILRTLNYGECQSHVDLHMPSIDCYSFRTKSSTRTMNDHRLFFPDISKLMIDIIYEKPSFHQSCPLFPNVDYLILKLPGIYSSSWNSLSNIFNFGETFDDDDAKDCIKNFSSFVHLSNITKIEFDSTLNISQWKIIQCILQECSSVNHLVIDIQLLSSKRLIHNPYLWIIFRRLRKIEIKTKKNYFPNHFTLEFVRCFPSLTHIALRVYSFDNCVFIADTLLQHFKNLSYLEIEYDRDTLLRDPFTHDYIVDKRRRTYPMNIIHEDKINVNNDGKVLQIWLL